MKFLPRFLFTGPLLFAFAYILSSGLRDNPILLALYVKGLAVAFLLITAAMPRFSVKILGVAICLAPMLGANALSLLVVAWLFAAECSRIWSGADVAAPTATERVTFLGILLIVVLCVCAAIRSVFLDVDFVILSSIARAGGLGALLNYILSSTSSWQPLPLFIGGYIFSLLLYETLCYFHRAGLDPFRNLFSGIGVGAALSVVVFFAQYLELHYLFSLNQSAFWRFTERYSASFSDPNAFGIMAVLLVPILLVQARQRTLLYLIPAILIVVILPWSGSRTAWLGLILWLAYYAVVAERRSHSEVLKRVATFAFAGAVLLGLLVGNPSVNDRLQKFDLAPGVSRVLATLHWDKGSERLKSRYLYARIAFEVWQDNALGGVGLGKFYEEQEDAAQRIGETLGEWRDNANNLYLHVLAEAGLLGLWILALASFFIFQAIGKRKGEYLSEDTERRYLFLSRSLLAVMLLLFTTGPHVFFEEVRYLLFALIALGVCSAPEIKGVALRRSRNQLFLAALFAPILYSISFIVSTPKHRPLGFYNLETTSTGAVRWTASEAYLSLCPTTPGASREFAFNAPRGDLSNQPLQIEVYRKQANEWKLLQTVGFRQSGWFNVSVPGSNLVQPSERYRFNVNSLWNPASGNEDGKGDPRWLGVMLKWPEEVCAFR